MQKRRHDWKTPAASLTAIILLFALASFSLYPANRGVLGIILFNGTKNLSTNSGASLDPVVSASGDKVYVVWSDKTPGNSEIIFSASTDGGETFTSKSKGRLSETAAASILPRISSSGSDVYIGWIEKDGSGKSDIYFKASHNSGSSFGSVENLSNSGTAAEPQVATTGGDVLVVWSDSKSGNREIYLASSDDGGESFNGPINLSGNSGVSDQPQVAATSDGHVYVAWRDSISGSKEILLRASDDKGAEFGDKKNLSHNAGSSGNPEIAASLDSVYVAWTDNTSGNVDVFFAASKNGGSSFGSAVNLSNTDGTSYREQIAAAGDKVYVTWRDTPREVYVRASANAGESFSDSINLSNDETDSGWPEISAEGDNVYLVWRAGPLEGLSKEVYIRTSEDRGDSFDDVINLSNNSGNSGPPQIASGSGSSVYVVWSDTTTGGGDVYFKKGS
ncbi:MAG: glycoside hydrolase [Nitrososphaera sp.]|nr:glycoside hydrolase [Nitrososphaera sp.]